MKPNTKSMDNRYYQALHQIVQCIDEIYYFVGTPMLFENYDSNIIVQKAVERNLEIIGKAVKRLKEANDTIAITDARKIINTRNLISHGYDEIQKEIKFLIDFLVLLVCSLFLFSFCLSIIRL